MNKAEVYYFDTSALLPYYREEAVSPLVQDFLSLSRPPLLISDLTRLEVASAIARWVRMDEISEPQANLLENTFVMDVHSGLFVSRQLTTVHYNQAEKWLSGRKTSLRTLDALHLACSWNFRAVLVTCDLVMHRAAEMLGVANTLISPPTNG